MRKEHLQLIQDQARVKVAERVFPAVDHETKGYILFVTLASVFAGVFYFWYYYWGDLWRVLAGG
jgi:hypothetical protein